MTDQLSHTEVTREALSIMDAPLDALGVLPTRFITPLERDRIATVGDLTRMTEQEFMRIPGLGKGALTRMKHMLHLKGLSFTEPDRHGHPPLPFPSMHDRLTRIEARLTVLELDAMLRAPKP